MSKEKTLQNKGAEGSYRLENFRRRTRYTTVFIILAIAFFVIIVVNINSGNVHIPLSRIVNILLTKNGDPKEVDIIW
ncbi:MAG: iron ABC transporter permease, partial [Firmicutes bacterium]|nr:iron ABC transporter permease [Bacillota bacterium]